MQLYLKSVMMLHIGEFQEKQISIDETVALAQHYSISLDALFLKSDNIIVQKTIEIRSLKDMLAYFKKSAQQIEYLSGNAETNLYCSAKDIPLFYFMDGTILSKFKGFVWLNMLNQDLKRDSFEKFVIDESFLEHMQKLRRIYEKVNVKEVWNDTAVNSSLQQIVYFYEAGLLELKSAVALCNDLKRIMNRIREKCSSPDGKFELYYNELILLNNNMLIRSPEKLTMFVPYTLLGYFITDDENGSKNVLEFFNQQIRNSKPLGQSGIREHQIFFNRVHRKIDFILKDPTIKSIYFLEKIFLLFCNFLATTCVKALYTLKNKETKKHETT